MKFNIEYLPATCPAFSFSDMSDWTLKGFVMFSPSLVSDCLTRELVDSNQNVVRCISSDIDLLFRLQNGERIDSAIAEELLSRMSSSIDSSLKDVFDNASDDEILDSVCSKYIQTPAQLEDYLRSLDSRLENLSSQELQSVVESSDISANDTDVKSVAESSSSD